MAGLVAKLVEAVYATRSRLPPTSVALLFHWTSTFAAQRAQLVGSRAVRTGLQSSWSKGHQAHHRKQSWQLLLLLLCWLVAG